MSVDISTYVGPYLRVKNKPKDSKNTYPSCPFKKCKNHGDLIDSKFCSECGAKIISITFTSKEPLNIWEYLDDFDETLFPAMIEDKPDGCDYIEYFIPNTNVKGIKGQCYFDPRYEVYEVSVGSYETVQSEINTFKNQFYNEIECLTNILGKENVEVKWGVLGWLC